MQWKKENVLILLSLLVLAFFLINMFSGGGRGRQQSRELIYSDFKNLVAAGEISNAQFVGDTRIEGFTLDGTPYRTYIPENDTKLVDFLRHFQVQINFKSTHKRYCLFLCTTLIQLLLLTWHLRYVDVSVFVLA